MEEPFTIPELLKRFNRSREELDTYATLQQTIAAVLGKSVPQLHNILRRVAEASTKSSVNMVLLGEEGTGKSTLASLLLGRNVSPTSKYEPGTVAPVFLEFGECEDPVYNITTLNGREPVTEEGVSVETFANHLLQQNNPGNKKNVVSGTVHLRHPLLAHGLRLADMPGIFGVNKRIAVNALDFVRSHGHMIIGVAKERSFRSLGDQLQTLGLTSQRHPSEEAERKLAAVVVNVWSFEFDEVEPEGKPIEALILQEVELWRKSATNALEIEADKCFVMSLKQLKTKRLLKDKEQLEYKRFCDHIWGFCDENGLYKSLKEAVARVKKASAVLQECLDTRRAYLDGLRSDPGLRAQIVADFKLHESAAVARWKLDSGEGEKGAGSGEKKGANWKQFDEEIWNTIEQSLNGIIFRSRTALKAVRAKVAQQCRERKMSEFEMGDHLRTLASVHNSLLQEISDVERLNTGNLESRYSAIAQEALDFIYTQLNLTTRGMNPAKMDFTARIVGGPLRLDFEKQFDLVRVGFTALGVLAGALAAFKLSSNTSVRLTGAVAGGTAGYAVDRIVRDLNREHVEEKLGDLNRLIEEYELQLSVAGEKNWQEQVERQKKHIGRTLRDTIAELGRLLGADEDSEIGPLLYNEELSRINEALHKKISLDCKLKEFYERIEGMEASYESEMAGLRTQREAVAYKGSAGPSDII